MDKIFHSTFDFFTHVIPGFGVVAAILVFDCELLGITDLFSIADEINVGGGIFLLAISYITGFAINPIGRFLYRNLGFYIWNEKIENDVEIFISDKYVMIRELSPTNFKYIETWNMFCAMSHNLSVASLTLFFVCIVKLFVCNISILSFFGFLMVVAFFSFLVFLQRAVRFSIWAAHDLNATISRLNLIEKAKKI